MTGWTLIRLSGWIEALNYSREGSGGAWWKKRRCDLHFLERSQHRPFAHLVGARYHEHNRKRSKTARNSFKSFKGGQSLSDFIRDSISIYQLSCFQCFHITSSCFILFLVGGLEHFLFFHILGIMIPIDFHIFQRGRYTTIQCFVSLLRMVRTDARLGHRRLDSLPLFSGAGEVSKGDTALFEACLGRTQKIDIL